MIGIDYQNRISQLLSEFSSTWIDLKTSFDLLYEAAKDFSKETHCCTGSQTITTVANQAAYDLNPDFMEILTKDDHDNTIVKYYDGSNTSWLSWQSYSDTLQNDNDPGTPQSFSIVDSTPPARMTGTATSSGNDTGGESVLTDTSADFSSLYSGDMVLNTTTGKSYIGVVKTAGTTTVTTSMFDTSTRGGAFASWAANDTYAIQPSSRYQVVLDPPPDTAGQIVTINYYAQPLPVYSYLGTYPFATGYEEALIKYAVWLYKYRDSKPNMGDPLYVAYEREMRKAKSVNRKAVGAVGFRVNFMKG